MKLSDIYSKNDKLAISFEFPPKNDFDGTKTNLLLEELNVLKMFNPSLISVTYGAGGSNQSQALDIISSIKNDLGVTPMPHFTCVSSNYENIKTYIEKIVNVGVKNILALRGDLPENCDICSDFRYASDLVKYIKDNTSLSVAVACYPEVHKDSVSQQHDLECFKKKIDLGAEVAYTQLLFNNDYYYKFVENCSALGINIPIIPGILPIVSFEQVVKMTQLSRINVPKKLFDILEKHKDDKQYIKEYGVEYASEQCSALISYGVKGFHFYTLNKSFSTKEILQNLL